MKIYLANGLFSQADRDFNEKIAREVRKQIPNVDLYVPQENGEINDKSKVATSKDIAFADCQELLTSDAIIAVIDGVEVDSGTAAELGIAYALDIPIFALCTDIRFNTQNIFAKSDLIRHDPFENQFMYRNLFLVGIIKENGHLFSDMEYMIDTMRDLL